MVAENVVHGERNLNLQVTCQELISLIAKRSPIGNPRRQAFDVDEVGNKLSHRTPAMIATPDTGRSIKAVWWLKKTQKPSCSTL